MANHPNRNGDLKRIKDAVAKRRMIGWTLTRLHVNQPFGDVAHARIGWRIHGASLEMTTHLHDIPHGVSRSEWTAPDDDIIELRGVWSDGLSRELCRWLRVDGFERHDCASHIAWLHDLPRST